MQKQGVQRAWAELSTVRFNDVLDDGAYSGSLNFGTDTPFADGAYYNVIVEDNKDEDTPNPDIPMVDKDYIVYIKSTDGLPISMSNV